MLKLWNKDCRVTFMTGLYSFRTERYKISLDPFPTDNSQIVLILEWFMWHDWYNFRAQKFHAFVLPVLFSEKRAQRASSIVLRTVNHCWKAKACVVGHYTENCLTERTLHLRAPSRNYLLETAPDWSMRQCYFPRAHSYVNDLWPALRIWRTNQSTTRIDIIFSKGKVPVKTIEKCSKRPRKAQTHPVYIVLLIKKESPCCTPETSKFWPENVFTRLNFHHFELQGKWSFLQRNLMRIRCALAVVLQPSVRNNLPTSSFENVLRQAPTSVVFKGFDRF